MYFFIFYIVNAWEFLFHIYSYEEATSQIYLSIFARFKEAEPYNGWSCITQKEWLEEVQTEHG